MKGKRHVASRARLATQHAEMERQDVVDFAWVASENNL